MPLDSPTSPTNYRWPAEGLTRSVRQHTDGELHTFSVGFAEERFDESPYAEEVAKLLGTHHHLVIMDADTYARRSLESRRRAVTMAPTRWHFDLFARRKLR